MLSVWIDVGHEMRAFKDAGSLANVLNVKTTTRTTFELLNLLFGKIRD